MDGMNRVFLMGNLGSDPEMRATASGKRVARLSLATRNVRKVDGAYVDTPDWHRVTAFDGTAEFLCKYAHKGDQVAVECALRPRKWQDAAGKTHYDVGVVVDRVLSIHSRTRREVAAMAEEQTPIEVDESPEQEAIPF